MAKGSHLLKLFSMDMNIDTREQLKSKIKKLEEKRAGELIALKAQVQETYEGLKFTNLIKSAFHELTSQQDFKKDSLNTAIGVTSGYVARKAIFGRSRGPLKAMLGAAVQFIVTKLVSNNVDSVRNVSKEVKEEILDEVDPDKHAHRSEKEK